MNRERVDTMGLDSAYIEGFIFKIAILLAVIGPRGKRAHIDQSEPANQKKPRLRQRSQRQVYCGIQENGSRE